jgi:hypothetical protein
MAERPRVDEGLSINAVPLWKVVQEHVGMVCVEHGDLVEDDHPTRVVLMERRRAK